LVHLLKNKREDTLNLGIFAAKYKPMLKNPKFNSIAKLQIALRKGTITCENLVQYYLTQISECTALNAYVEVFAHEALEKAKEQDRILASNPDTIGRLFGVVISLKDNICYAGHQVTAASKILEGFTSLYSATCVERLLAEGAIIIGRTNCDQFGMGSSNENSIYGPVKNAIDSTRVAGGSSGGAAVSLQTDTCLLAIGTDTGGSVRQPAAFCGVLGFKPTYGCISRHGLLAYGSSFDQVGVLAHEAQDIALLLEIMAGPDEFDSTVSLADVPAKTFKKGQKLKIAYFPEAVSSEGLEENIRKTTQNYIDSLRQEGHFLEEVTFKYLDYIIPTYYVLTTAEASSNLSRYDGVRYGYRHPNAKNLEENYLLSRTEGFSKEVKKRILLGTFVLSSGYYDAYYTKAQQIRRLIKERIEAIFEDYDLILIPAAPSVAWRFGEKSTDPTEMYLSDVFTVLANLAGIPAIALPIGTHRENGMPIGVQLMAGAWQERLLLEFAS
jgi:aspartyl-tRNA(Asn)/glutamyl-tRNA(Gln) amidotransferase subunit A